MKLIHVSASRRNLLSILATGPFVCSLPAVAAGLGPPYTQKTAPDALSRQILAARLSKLDQGAPVGVHPGYTIHRNMPQIIEQNLARMDPPRMTRLLKNMSPAEWSDLAQLYTTAVADTGHAPRLLDVMATRLNGSQLAAVSQHFGFASTYEAVLRAAPAKALEFQQYSSTAFLSPAPGLLQFGPQGRFASTSKLEKPGPAHTPNGIGQFLNYTPYEIYLSFRTAPIGALGVAGALYESAVVMSSALGGAYTTGYAIGTAISPLIQTYAPSLWDAIGGTIYEMIESIFSAPTPEARGEAEYNGAGLFDLGTTGDAIGATGGDYQVCVDWYDWAYGDGGGGCGRDRYANCEYF
jgi:hypothetical protein